MIILWYEFGLYIYKVAFFIALKIRNILKMHKLDTVFLISYRYSS